MTWLEKIPWWVLIVLAVWMAAVPIGASHFVEKWRMLFGGTLRRPLDWFDLLMHSAPMALLVLKLIVRARTRA